VSDHEYADELTGIVLIIYAFNEFADDGILISCCYEDSVTVIILCLGKFSRCEETGELEKRSWIVANGDRFGYSVYHRYRRTEY
jgi:hypothetical protein